MIENRGPCRQVNHIVRNACEIRLSCRRKQQRENRKSTSGSVNRKPCHIWKISPNPHEIRGKNFRQLPAEKFGNIDVFAIFRVRFATMIQTSPPAPLGRFRRWTLWASWVNFHNPLAKWLVPRLVPDATAPSATCHHGKNTYHRRETQRHDRPEPSSCQAARTIRKGGLRPRYFLRKRRRCHHLRRRTPRRTANAHGTQRQKTAVEIRRPASYPGKF